MIWDTAGSRMWIVVTAIDYWLVLYAANTLIETRVRNRVEAENERRLQRNFIRIFQVLRQRRFCITELAVFCPSCHRAIVTVIVIVEVGEKRNLSGMRKRYLRRRDRIEAVGWRKKRFSGFPRYMQKYSKSSILQDTSSVASENGYTYIYIVNAKERMRAFDVLEKRKGNRIWSYEDTSIKSFVHPSSVQVFLVLPSIGKLSPVPFLLSASLTIFRSRILITNCRTIFRFTDAFNGSNTWLF